MYYVTHYPNGLPTAEFPDGATIEEKHAILSRYLTEVAPRVSRDLTARQQLMRELKIYVVGECWLMNHGFVPIYKSPRPLTDVEQEQLSLKLHAPTPAVQPRGCP